MNEKHSLTSLLIGWLGFGLQFVASYYSTILTVACGVTALIASIYSIFASRAKARKYKLDAELDELEIARRKKTP